MFRCAIGCKNHLSAAIRPQNPIGMAHQRLIHQNDVNWGQFVVVSLRNGLGTMVLILSVVFPPIYQYPVGRMDSDLGLCLLKDATRISVQP